MTSFDRSDFQRIVTAAAGALVLSTACVFSAVGPARAAEAAAPTTVSAWQANVDRQIDRNLRMPAIAQAAQGATVVQVHFDGAGTFDGATMVRSSGDAAFDREALRTARSINYPVLPGSDRDVLMHLSFGGYSYRPVEAGHDAATAFASYKKAHRYQTAGLPQG